MPALILGQTSYGVIASAGEHDLYTVSLVAGTTYEFRLHGIGGAGVPDTFLSLLNPSNIQVAFNDDAGAAIWDGASGLDSRIVFTATSTGTYTLDVSGFSTATGDYILTATPQTVGGMVFTTDEIAWQLIDNGEQYFGSPAGAAFNVGADNALTFNISGLSASAQFLARAALTAWTNVTGIDFTEVSVGGEILFQDGVGINAATNLSYIGNTITGSTVTITSGWLTQFGSSINSYSFETFIHEIGHALGLAHGGNYNGNARFLSPIDASQPDTNYYLNDSLAYSIMSYMQAANDEFRNPGDANTFVNASFRYMLTPMIADDIAIQYLYGVRGALRFGGDTVYGFHANSGNTAIDSFASIGASACMSIFDEAGSDAIDMSGYGGAQSIDMNAESFSDVLGGRMNLSIARNTLIEIAVGGTGTDLIYGNSLNNTIDGNLGADAIIGGRGNDTMYGGVGSSIDTVNYITSEAGININMGAGVTINDGLQGRDQINGFEQLIASNFADLIIGSERLEYINGMAGDDYISYAGAGNDVIDGGAGINTISYYDVGVGIVLNLSAHTSTDGQGGTDTLINIQQVYGSNWANDSMTGDAGYNVLRGFGGNDFLAGGQSADTFYGGLGNDQFIWGQTDFAVGVWDTVQDWQFGGGFDLLHFYNVPGLDLFTVGGHTYIAPTNLSGGGGANVLNGGGVIVLNVTSAELAGHFLFN